jgi:hypothetical protein
LLIPVGLFGNTKPFHSDVPYTRRWRRPEAYVEGVALLFFGQIEPHEQSVAVDAALNNEIPDFFWNLNSLRN